MINNKFLKILSYVALWIVVWTLIDWIIDKQNFVFSPLNNLLYPAIGGIVFGLLDPVGKMKKK